MSAFSLGDLDPFSVQEFSGFDLPSDVTRLRLLDDGSSESNEILQQGSSGLLTATLAGRAVAYDTIATLRDYRRTHEELTFTEPDAGPWTVVVLEFASTRNARSVFLWDWTMTLVALPSGS